jgi:hypothetical protein
MIKKMGGTGYIFAASPTILILPFIIIYTVSTQKHWNTGIRRSLMELLVSFLTPELVVVVKALESQSVADILLQKFLQVVYSYSW